MRTALDSKAGLIPTSVQSTPPPRLSPVDCINAAAIDAVAAHGYADASVARVLAIAGVSRATFYEHFSGREDAFLCAYRQAVAGLREEVGRAIAASGPQARLGAFFDALCSAFAADPGMARIVLLEASAGPPAIRGEHAGLLDAVERRIVSCLEEQEGGEPIQIPAAALAGGVSGLFAFRLLAGRGGELSRLRSGISAWLAAYRLAGGGPPLAQARWWQLGRFGAVARPRCREVPQLLPRGRSALSPERAAEARRRRLLDATARIAAEGGCRALTIAGIAAAARVPRAAFYSHFESKQAALLAAQEQLIGGAMAAAAAAYAPAAPWPQRLSRATEAYLGHLAAEPDYTRLVFLESDAAGATVVAQRYRSASSFAIFLEGGYGLRGGAAPPPRLCAETTAAAVFALIRRRLGTVGPEQLTSLAPVVSYVCLAPFVGPERAAELVAARAPAAR